MRYSTKWLRAESLAILLAVLAAYAATDASWLLFIGLLLVPDIAMLGYLWGPRVGAFSYDLVHLYLWPLLLLALWAVGVAPWAVSPALIWAAHIAMDRAAGYGLKEPDSFRHTHLGEIGAGGGSTPSGLRRRRG